MKVDNVFESYKRNCWYGRLDKRLADKTFVRLWQTSLNVEDFKRRRKILWDEYMERAPSRYGKRDLKNLKLHNGWTPTQRATHLRRNGVLLKALARTDTPQSRKAAERAEHYQRLKEYAIEVISESR